MEKIIEVNIANKEDFLDKYNKKRVTNDITDYIIRQSMYVTKKDKLKIIINKKCRLEQNCIQMIKDALNEEYNNSMKLHHSIDIKQTFLVILGMAALIFYSILREEVIWGEILLITGWVGIWEAMDLEFFDDASERRKRRTLKKLLSSEIIENDIL